MLKSNLLSSHAVAYISICSDYKTFFFQIVEIFKVLK